MSSSWIQFPEDALAFKLTSEKGNVAVVAGDRNAVSWSASVWLKDLWVMVYRPSEGPIHGQEQREFPSMEEAMQAAKRVLDKLEAD